MTPEGRPVVAVYSQFSAGHIPGYHQAYCASFTRCGCRVLDVPLPPRSLPSRVLGRLSKILSPGRAAWMEAARRIRKAEKRAGTGADAVFLVYGDLGFAHPASRPELLPVLFPWRWACVITGPQVIRTPEAVFPPGEHVLSAENCRAVVVTDPIFIEPCRRSWPGRLVLDMPEITRTDPPAETDDLVRFKTFAAGRRVVGLLGVVGLKKNIGAFLNLARRAEGILPGVVFVIAGDFGPGACPREERRILERDLRALPSNCRFFPSPVPDGAAFNAWVEICDVVWVAYKDVPYRSNVLTKAAFFRRRVLASPGHVMARHVIDFGLGEVVDPADTEAVMTSLARLLSYPSVEAGFDAFNRLNSPERLDETVATLIPALVP
jgi:glycosyltransferase involved in cell wall biosynthesis